MIVKPLSETEPDAVLDCFFKAFENYFVALPTDRAYYKQRWKAAKVDFNYSYGAFEEGQLVGFIIHAIDQRGGLMTALNTGTGVLPAFRGRGCVKAMYQLALQELPRIGIEKCMLEVITQNKAAIRSYEGIGFRTSRLLHCFAGTLDLQHPLPFDLEQVALHSVDWSRLPNQSFYSWDNQAETVRNSPFACCFVGHEGKRESFFIIHPENGYIAQLDVLLEANGNWERLFGAIQSLAKQVRINNVDAVLTEKLDQIQRFGLKPTVDQFEMELFIHQ